MATLFRYLREATELLATHAPPLTAALWRLAANGHRLGILDGMTGSAAPRTGRPTRPES